ncbi:MAG: SLC13 family permease [Pseudomonadota bacterium]
MTPIEPGFEMWATLLLIAVAIAAYASERIPVEITALGVLGGLPLMFHLAALLHGGEPIVGLESLLMGFASPALIAVSALLVVGQAMVNTGALEEVARAIFSLSRGSFRRAVLFSLGGATGLSGFLNNTPIVVIFLPVLRSIADRYKRHASAVMIPLSYAAILGGMITLIGSSSNLLVSGELAARGQTPLGFFDMTVPGLALALAGSVYVLLLPRFLPKRAGPSDLAADGKQFIAELDIDSDSPLIGAESRGGLFPALANVTVRLIQRGDRTILPPFEGMRLETGDILILAATRRVLTELLTKNTGKLLGAPGWHEPLEATPANPNDLMLVEAMIRPASRMLGQTLDLSNFRARSQCTVLGIQRRARMLRARLAELRFEAGDVLLLVGRESSIERLRTDPDVLLMEWSATEMPNVSRAPIAAAIFLGIVAPAALDLVPIVITALLGVVALVVTGCLNIRQAARAVDRRIVLIIASAMALGTALEATGGAAYLAMLTLDLLAGAPPALVLSTFFLMVALFTNILSNNACAVLFTPIALNIAAGLNADPLPFALAVLFAANCSFATPFGYQTNLLVMGPGQYRFADFVVAGLPLVLIIWLAFSLFAPWYYAI